MKDRFKVIPSVYLLLIRDGKILLLRRCNTGYYDGYYGLPAGHVEAGETLTEGMMREVAEEVGVVVRRVHLHLAHVLYRMSDIPAPHERVDFFFTIDTWQGEPKNMEPEKCDDIGWFPLHALPDNMVPEVRHAIERFQSGDSYSELWQRNDS